MSYRIKFLWDDEAAVWIATSQDVPGLVLESGSFDALVERVRIAVPELVDLNGAKPDSLKLSYYTLNFGNLSNENPTIKSAVSQQRPIYRPFYRLISNID